MTVLSTYLLHEVCWRGHSWVSVLLKWSISTHNSTHISTRFIVSFGVLFARKKIPVCFTSSCCLGWFASPNGMCPPDLSLISFISLLGLPLSSLQVGEPQAPFYHYCKQSSTNKNSIISSRWKLYFYFFGQCRSRDDDAGLSVSSWTFPKSTTGGRYWIYRH